MNKILPSPYEIDGALEKFITSRCVVLKYLCKYSFLCTIKKSQGDILMIKTNLQWPLFPLLAPLTLNRTPVFHPHPSIGYQPVE